MASSDADLPSPAFCIDLERLRANCARMLALGVPLRPHLKTSKCVEVARLMAGAGGAGALGVVCSTLRECEHFAGAGFKDILYGVPLEPSKLPRALALRQRLPAFHLMLDGAEGLAALEAFMAVQQAEVMSVWVAIDCGYGREGARHDAEGTLALLAAVHASPYCALAGLYSHSGDSYNCAAGRSGAAEVGSLELARMGALAAAAAARGVPIPALSLGATPSVCSGGSAWALPAAAAAAAAAAAPAGGAAAPPPPPPPPRLELHPGNYAFFDRQQVASGSCALEDCAVYVLARVCGVYRERNALLIDAGAAALHKDAGGLGTWGCLREDPNMVLTKLTQEVAVVSTADGSTVDFERYALGAAVRVLVNHSCMTAAMHEVYHVTQRGEEGGAGEGRRVVDAWRPCKWW